MTAAPAEVVWHDVECGGYDADLETWERLAERFGEPVCELGAGTGRVALHLARRGHSVAAVELASPLASELRRRAAAEGLAVEVVRADARELALRRRFPLVLAPMQFIQLFDAAEDRAAVLRRAAAHLEPAGALALAIVDGVPDGAAPVEAESAPVLPDVRERDGFVYSSLPLGVSVSDGAIESARRRQRVSPAGEIVEEGHLDRLALLDAAAIEAEAAAAGMSAIEWIEVEATESHVGSRIALLEAAA